MSGLIRRNLPPSRRVETPIEVTGIEVVTSIDRLHIAYDRFGFDELLQEYVEVQGDISDVTNRIEIALDEYAMAITDLANSPGHVDVDTVRGAFDRLYEGMNQAAAPKLGNKPPRTATEAILQRLGVKTPEPLTYLKPLDDKYWGKQFMEQYQSERYPVMREDGESERSYFTRYVRACLGGFPWAYFSHIR